jgi:hypothetical protein
MQTIIGDDGPRIKDLASLVFGLWPLIGFGVAVFLVVGIIRARRKANWKFFTHTRARWKADRNRDVGDPGQPGKRSEQ